MSKFIKRPVKYSDSIREEFQCFKCITRSIFSDLEMPLTGLFIFVLLPILLGLLSGRISWGLVQNILPVAIIGSGTVGYWFVRLNHQHVCYVCPLINKNVFTGVLAGFLITLYWYYARPDFLVIIFWILFVTFLIRYNK